MVKFTSQHIPMSFVGSRRYHLKLPKVIFVCFAFLRVRSYVMSYYFCNNFAPALLSYSVPNPKQNDNLPWFQMS